MNVPTIEANTKASTSAQLDLPATLCLALVRPFLSGPLARFNARQRPVGARYESRENYEAQRLDSVTEYLGLFSPFGKFEGKTVLELGCSSGYLLNAFLRRESFTALGADIDPVALSLGRSEHGEKIQFVQSTHTSIPVPGEGVDIIYAIDTVEHLIRPFQIFMECYRVLRPGGLFLIHFPPWYSPDGTHLEDILPVPWLNLIFSPWTPC